MNLSDPPLQLLWVFGEELELGAVALWVFPRVIVTDFSWKMRRKTNHNKCYRPSLTTTLTDHLSEIISCGHLVRRALIANVKWCSCLCFRLVSSWNCVDVSVSSCSHLVICKQPAEQRPRSCTGGDRGTDPSSLAGRRDICERECKGWFGVLFWGNCSHQHTEQNCNTLKTLILLNWILTCNIISSGMLPAHFL